jgi:hypothetical protein
LLLLLIDSIGLEYGVRAYIGLSVSDFPIK